jgi:hypothetical protein
MTRAEMIDYIIEYSGDEFESTEDYVELAKSDDNRLTIMIININNYRLENE